MRNDSKATLRVPLTIRVRNTCIGLDNAVMLFSAMLSAYRSQINLKTGS
jgi:hypothetical protein